jgi:hypothetical protein
MKRYSLRKKGKFYEILVSRNKTILGRLTVDLAPPRMDYMILKVNSHRHIFLRSEDRVSLSRKDKITLEEIETNLYSKKGIHLNINGHKIMAGEAKRLKEFVASSKNSSHRINVKKGRLLLGRIFINME